ncbi:copper transporter [Wukongibacter baidiensis]|uniref:copper transporter n=1 Tax=Wukongibacter baidiensis TaxID=1723361 RepID=UPI003D7F510C
MVINTKHFIITIIAIFLSLGVGVFIGAIIDGQNLFIEQQKVLVSQIEEEFDGFRQKNYELIEELKDYKEQNNRNSEVIDTIYNELADESLAESNIMIINMFTDEDYLDLKDTLDNIGVKKSPEVKVPKDSEISIDTIRRNFKGIYEIGELKKGEIYQGNIEKVFSRLVMEDRSLLPFYLKQMDFLEYKGDINSTIDYVIIIDNGYKIRNKYYKALRREFINLIKENNIPVMGIERSDISVSSMPFYKELDIPTVDNSETKVGQIAMLMILKGKKGHFGEKETAEGLLPKDFFVFE